MCFNSELSVDDPTQNSQLLVISALVPIVVMETQVLIRKVFRYYNVIRLSLGLDEPT